MALTALALPTYLDYFTIYNTMADKTTFDVIIIGGSYSGLAAAMALGRALKQVLVIDSGQPCNRQTPHSHNFLTQDGQTPAHIASVARQQVEKYDTVRFFKGIAAKGTKSEDGFEIITATGERFKSQQVVFATGIRDIIPDIKGFAECWGISVLHCPFCHGYEVRGQKTGILATGNHAFELAGLISNWTDKLTLFTNGPSGLTTEQIDIIISKGIRIVESLIQNLEHDNGHIRNVVFEGGAKFPMDAVYARVPFEQSCLLPVDMGCELTDDGYIRIDASQQTTVEGIYACGDNTTRMRTVANAVSMGTIAGMMISRKMILEKF